MNEALPTYVGLELFCGEKDGIVEVVDSTNRLVVRLSLIAAEDLSTMLAYQASNGRHREREREARA